MIQEVAAQRALELTCGGGAGGDYIYLDVRTVEEFAEGHAPGAVNIPIMNLGPQGRLVPNPEFMSMVVANLPLEQPIICGCKSGGRSSRAVEALTEYGYQNVVNLAGGFHGKPDPYGNMVTPGWCTLGLPLCTHQPGTCRPLASLRRPEGA